MQQTVLYSFRRCPYAIRARLALAVAGYRTELREVVLRDKPDAFLAVSPSATVPCLVTPRGVIDESLDIMIHALKNNDPQRWLEMPATGMELIAEADGPFKDALDKTKYATRYPGNDPAEARDRACGFLTRLDERLSPWLFDRPTLADFAILPFVRQFAFVDRQWFDQCPWPALHVWLNGFLDSALFASVMHKYPQWTPDSPGVVFPDPATIA